MSEFIVPIEIQDFANTMPEYATEPALERHLSDITELYEAGPSVMESTGDKLLYRFWTIEPAPGVDRELACGLTVLFPGTVGGEYHMTAGHFHIGTGAEIYVALKGDGLLLLESRAGELKVCKFVKDSLIYIPSGWAHRAVNIGQEELRFLAVWSTGIEHDYETIRQCGFGCRVVANGNTPTVRRRLVSS